MTRLTRIESAPSAIGQFSYPSSITAWTIVVVLGVANLFSFIDRQILALLIDPIRASMGVSDLQISLLIGPAFAVFYGVLGLPLGWAVDRFRRMRLAGGGVALWSLMTVLGGFTANFSLLLVSRVGVGVGEAILVPAANSIIADSFPPQRRSRAMQYFVISVYVGSGLALMFGGLLVALVSSGALGRFGLAGRLPWQMVLVLVGAPGILVAAIIALFPEPSRHDVFAKRFGRSSEPGFLHFLRTRRGALASHFFGFSSVIVASYSMGAWAPSVLIRDHGWTASLAGVALGITGTVTAIVSILATTWVSDRLEEADIRNAKFRIGLSVSLIGIVAAAAMATGRTAPLFLASYGVMVAVVASGVCMGAAAVPQVTPNQYRGRVLGLYLLIASLLGSIGAPAVALLSSKILAPPFALTTGLAVTCAAALLCAAASFLMGLAPFDDAVRRLDADTLT